MLKRLVILLLEFGAGLTGNLVAGWIQQDVWSNLFTPTRLVGTLAGAGLMLFMLAWLESERALPWNWRWHRFWYLRELLGNPDLQRWETDFARLELVQRPRKVSGAEIIVEGERRDLIEALHDLISGRLGEVRRALVLGEPGSGKTTGLECLTLELATERKRRLGFGQPMPVLVRLGNFQEGDLLEYIGESMRHGTRGGSGKVLGKGIEELIEHGRVVLLFDALDEALGERRELVLAELGIFLESQAYEHVPLVVTSRTREDPGGRLANLQVFEIQDLSDEAVEVFIRTYKRPEQSEEEIQERLEGHELLEPRGLGRSPFWLRLIVESGAFEGSKGQILNQAVDTLLAREWDEKPEAQRSWRRVLPRSEQLEETKRGLAWLGYRMFVENQVAIEWDGALGELAKWLERRIGVERLRPQDILGLGRDAQLLVYELGPVRFRHRLLQEFMTAWALRVEEGLLTEGLLGHCVRNVGWWQTVIMLAGVEGPSRRETLVQQILAIADAQPGSWIEDHGLALAAGCVLEGGGKEQIVQTALERYLSKIEQDGISPAVRKATLGLCEAAGEKALEMWGRLLKGLDWGTAHLAAELLAEVGTSAAARRLIEDGLKPWSEAVQKESLDALIRIGEPAVGPLIDALEWRRKDLSGGSPWHYLSPVDALAGIGEPAIGSLVNALTQATRYLESSKARDRGFRARFAVGPLSLSVDTGDTEDKDRRIRMRQIREGATEALGRIGEPAVKWLLTMLSSENRILRMSAVVALGEVGGETVVGPLIEALNDDDGEVRAETANALGKIKDKRSIAPLVALLPDWHFECRAKTAWALGEIGDRQAVEPLIETLNHAGPWMVRHVARALGKIGDSRAVEPLMRELVNRRGLEEKDIAWALGNLRARKAMPQLIGLLPKGGGTTEVTCWALGMIGDRRAVNPLIEVMMTSQEDVGWVSSDAARALGMIGDGEAAEALLASMREGRRLDRHNLAEWAQWALYEIGPAATGALITAPRKGYLYHDSLELLGETGSPHAVSSLVQKLTACENWMHCDALWALVRIGGPAVDALITVLEEGAVEARIAAAIALANIGCNRAIEALKAAVHQGDWRVRYWVTHVLGELKRPEARETFSALLCDKEPAIRRAAVQALGKLGGEDARAVLFPVLEDDEPSVQVEAAFALACLGEVSGRDALVRALEDPNVIVRFQAVERLRQLRDPETTESLCRASKDYPDVRESAIYALGELGAMECVETVVAALSAEDKGVREAAAVALARIGGERVLEALDVAPDSYELIREHMWRARTEEAINDIDDDVFLELLRRALQNAEISEPSARHLPVKELLVAALWNEDTVELATSKLGQCTWPWAVEILSSALIHQWSYSWSNGFLFAQALGRSRDSRAIPALVKALKDDTVWKYAAEALGKIGDAQAVDALTEALRRSDWEEEVAPYEPKDAATLREAAAIALGKIGDEKALGPLISALGDRRPKVREAGAWALGLIGDEGAVAALGKALEEDYHSRVRWKAAQALWQIGGQEALRFLESAVEDEDCLVADIARGV